ncbi:MAG: D-alanyl-D-alanine carboxypeptidase, partial [Butyrivibrio sp.]|nr:D-alanyl-D-alanine carboxypeptidase [Butyrivibrio sp.]
QEIRAEQIREIRESLQENDLPEGTGDAALAQGENPMDAAEEISALDEENQDAGMTAGEAFAEQHDLFYEGYSVHRSIRTRNITNEKVISDGAILIDADTGDVVAERDGNKVISPASMTKIMTILVAAEHLTEAQLEDTVEITREMTDYAFSHECSIVGFDVGERPTVRDLFYGTILPSGADAAVALAEYVSGSQEDFVALMNDKLAALGLDETAHFTNCVGLYDEAHYCSLTDMAMILKAAVENDFCREVLAEHIYTTTATAEHPEGITISNWFLRRIEDKDTHGLVVCAKTGFVNESGCCAASYSGADDGRRYFLVTSGAWSSWRCIYDQVEIYAQYLKGGGTDAAEDESEPGVG